tara:strand:+ start:340 stop:804 length:465 start_codon:yes stop_codon:yes gene_type:complete
MVSESLKMKGHLKIKLNGETVRDVPNKVVFAGKAWVAQRIGATSQPNAMSKMGVGTGTVEPADNDSALGSEVGAGSRPNVQTETDTGNPQALDNRQITYTATFPSGATTHDGALTEAGIFNAASGGTMLCRTTFAAVNKTENDSLTIEWVITIS